MQIEMLDTLDGHEKLLRCTDNSSGLNALISIHSTKYGPAAGGCRMFDYSSMDEAIHDVQRLSRGMTYKNRVADLPLGGGKSVIIGDAKTSKTTELLRAFGQFVNSLDGTYYTAEDVGISPDDMAIVKQETEFVAGLDSGEFASGDPSPITAKGVFLCLKRAVEYKLGKSSLSGVKIAIQGLGHVGLPLAGLLHQSGASLTVTDIDKSALKKAEREFNATVVELDEIYDVDVDVFAPCAMGAILNEKTAYRLKAAIITGAANNQLSDPFVGDILKDRGIFYGPDYIVNGGGIINVAMEILKVDDENFSRKRITGLVRTLDTVIAIAEMNNVGMHIAADMYVEEQLSKSI